MTESNLIETKQPETGFLMYQLFLPLMMMLLFLESFRVFIGQIYFQNLGTMSLGASVALVFLLLSPGAIILLRRVPTSRLLMLSVIGVILFRLIMPFVQPFSFYYLICAGLVVAFFGMYLPVGTSICLEPNLESLPSGSALLSIAFCLAIASDLTLRTIGVTWDPTTGPVGILLVPVLCILTAFIAYKSNPLPSKINPLQTNPGGLGKVSRVAVAGTGLGFGGLMFILLTFLGYPNIIARWTSSSYEFATLSTIFGLILYPLIIVSSTGKNLMMRREFIAIVNLFAIIECIDLAYIFSPLAGILAGVTIFAFLLDLRLLWGYLDSGKANLTDLAVFYFNGMLMLLLFTLFYVLTLVAGLLLPALEGLTPYLIVISSILAILPPLILVIFKKEVTR